MSDIPFKMIGKYEGAPLYQVDELAERSCRGCCFEEEMERSDTICRHSGSFSCTTNSSICVRNLDEYKLVAVTLKLTGEMP